MRVEDGLRKVFLHYLLSSLYLICVSFSWQAIQATFREEEVANSCHKQMKEEEGRRHTAVEAFSVIAKSIQDLKNKLLEERGREKMLH